MAFARRSVFCGGRRPSMLVAMRGLQSSCFVESAAEPIKRCCGITTTTTTKHEVCSIFVLKKFSGRTKDSLYTHMLSMLPWFPAGNIFFKVALFYLPAFKRCRAMTSSTREAHLRLFIRRSSPCIDSLMERCETRLHGVACGKSTLRPVRVTQPATESELPRAAAETQCCVS